MREKALIRKGISRVLSMMLCLALLLIMVPSRVLAAGPMWNESISSNGNGYRLAAFDPVGRIEIKNMKVPAVGVKVSSIIYNLTAGSEAYEIEEAVFMYADSFEKLAPDDVFKEGREYILCVGVRAKQGYTLSNDARFVFNDGEIETYGTRMFYGAILYGDTVAMSPRDHDFTVTKENPVTYKWSADGKTCTAIIACSDCGVKIKKTCTITSVVKTPATYTEPGITRYTAKVAYNGQTYKSTKDVADISKLTVDSKLSAITGVKVVGSTANAIRLSWAKNKAVEGYQIEQLMADGSWKMIKKIVGADTTEYRIGNLTAGTGYKFRIRGYNTVPVKTYSDYTNVVTCTKLPAMTNVKVAGRSTNAVRLSWDKNKMAEGYQIEKKVKGEWKLYKKITTADILEYRITNLTSATAYAFRVRAYKVVDGCVSYSDYVTLNTSTK